VQKIQAPYEAEYSNSGHISLAATNLNELNFTLSAKSPTQAVRATVGQKDHFFEVRLAPQASAGSSLVVHSAANLANGVSVQSRDATALKAVVTHGLIAAQNNNVVLQKTDEFSVGRDAVKFSLDANKALQLESPVSLGSISVNTQTVDKNAAVKLGAVRVLTGRPAQP